MSNTTRDMQKAKAYRSENALRESHSTTLSFEECQAFAIKISTSAYVLRKYGKRKLRVVHGRGGGMAHWNGDISLGVWARTDLIVLHEAAHVYSPTTPAHGWQWAGTYVDLVRHFLGKETSEALKAEFRKNHVRFVAPRAPKTLSPEQRAANIERLAAARAARTPAAPKPDKSKELTGTQIQWLLNLHSDVIRRRESPYSHDDYVQVRGHSNHQVCTWKALERRGMVTLELLPNFKRTYHARLTEAGEAKVDDWMGGSSAKKEVAS